MTTHDGYAGKNSLARPTRRKPEVREGRLLQLLSIAVSLLSSLQCSPPRLAGTKQALESAVLVSLTGNEAFHLSEYIGRPLMLNFWASWCVPCRQELPRLQSLHREFSGHVQIIGINTADEKQAARAFLLDRHVGYPNAFDRDGSLQRELGLRGLPATVFVSRNGTVVGRIQGVFPEAQLRKYVRVLAP